MLQLGAPLGLLALAALLVPILIHLIRRPVPVVRLGSLRFLTESHRRLKSVRWRDILLLVLRLGLLAALALLLAAPRWEPRAPKPVHWLLAVPGASLDEAARTEWERLRAEGFEARLLAAGFPRIDTLDVEMEPTVPDAWSLLREAGLRLSPGSRIVVFGPPRLAFFRGSRPALAGVEVRWRTTDGASLRTAIDSSQSLPPARIAVRAAADRAEDARHVRAVVMALSAAGRNVMLTEEEPDWIFQLGAVTLPDAWQARVEQGANLVTDAAAGRETVRFFEAGGSSIRLRRRAAAPASSAAPVLVDSMGEPLLTVERTGAGRHWRFASRFHPEWNDWPLGTAFPAWWADQFQPEPASPDDRLLATAQTEPQTVEAGSVEAQSRMPSLASTDLRALCWILAASLFVLERALTYRGRRMRPEAVP